MRLPYLAVRPGVAVSAVTDAIYDQLLCHVHFHDFRERDARFRL